LAGSLSCTISLPANFPTNPFQHKYHPDHNNLNEQFKPLPSGQEEAYSVTRQIQLQFTVTDPEDPGLEKPGWGDIEMGGIYNETITGLHKQDIKVQGFFRLRRATVTPVLNQ
jgi:hypothetical protein